MEPRRGNLPNEHLRHEPRVVSGLANDTMCGNKRFPFGEYCVRLCQQLEPTLEMGEALLRQRHRQAVSSAGSCWASHDVPELDGVLDGDCGLILEPEYPAKGIKDFGAVRIGCIEHPQKNTGVEQATHQS